jgi:cytochrome c biogenesis protein CcmG/thiol:disulfide interchange protein DsbE
MRNVASKLVWLIILICFLAGSAQGSKKLAKAPNFTAPNLEGDKVELKALLENGPVLISFWAIHCKPCIKELNQLLKLYPEYNEKGFEILAIDVDGPRGMSRVKSKVKGYKWTFPVLLDTNKDIYRKYHVLGIPHTVVIDPQGNVRYTHTTYRSGDEKKIWEKVDQIFEELKEDEKEEEGEESEE